jgi:Uma2 family endonuclease
MATTFLALADVEPGQIVQTDLTLEEFLALDPDQLDPPALEYEGDGLVRRKMSPNSDHAAIAFGLSHIFGAYRGRSGRRLYGFVELRTNVARRSRLPDVAIYVGSRPAENERKQALTVAALSIEIRSPRQSLVEQQAKCRWYLEHDGSISILVDPDNRSVTVFSRHGAGSAIVEHRYDASNQTHTLVELDAQFPGLDLSAAQIFGELEDSQ